jgi:hypothetical protein
MQALAETDLSERARARAQQIAREADVRKVAPRDFFMGDDWVYHVAIGEGRIETPADTGF